MGSKKKLIDEPALRTVAALALFTLSLHAVGGVYAFFTRPSAVAAISTPTPAPAKSVAVPVMTRPQLPPPLSAPPHSTREELSALLRYLKAGGDLTDSQRRELWNKGLRFRMEPNKPHTLTVTVPPGYLPEDRVPMARQPQSTESAHDRWRRLNNVR